MVGHVQRELMCPLGGQGVDCMLSSLLSTRVRLVWCGSWTLCAQYGYSRLFLFVCFVLLHSHHQNVLLHSHHQNVKELHSHHQNYQMYPCGRGPYISYPSHLTQYCRFWYLHVHHILWELKGPLYAMQISGGTRAFSLRLIHLTLLLAILGVAGQSQSLNVLENLSPQSSVF